MFGLFPRLPAAIASNAGIREEQPYLRRLYWSLSALYLWLSFFGGEYPNLRSLWRTELDVVYLGPGGIGGMVERASSIQADVLLPRLTTRAAAETHRYAHFRRNERYLLRHPPWSHLWSLVSIGRYSVHFLRDLMLPQWQQGQICYEEVSLPTTCRASPNCTLKTLDEAFDVRHLQYRAPHAEGRWWSCRHFTSIGTQRSRCGRPELWHPMKDRRCLVAAYEAHLETPQRTAGRGNCTAANVSSR